MATGPPGVDPQLLKEKEEELRKARADLDERTRDLDRARAEVSSTSGPRREGVAFPFFFSSRFSASLSFSLSLSLSLSLFLGKSYEGSM
jgi:hypothetical protein